MQRALPKELVVSDEERFRAFYAEHARLVRGVVFGMCGPRFLDDLAQDVFVKAWRGLDGFEGRSAPRTWLYRITVRTVIDHLRSRGAKAFESTDMDTLASAPAEANSETEERKLVREAVAQLDEAHRAVVVLHYFEDQALGEIAAILEIPLGTVKSRLHFAKEKLRALFAARGVSL